MFEGLSFEEFIVILIVVRFLVYNFISLDVWRGKVGVVDVCIF